MSAGEGEGDGSGRRGEVRQWVIAVWWWAVTVVALVYGLLNAGPRR